MDHEMGPSEGELQKLRAIQENRKFHHIYLDAKPEQLSYTDIWAHANSFAPNSTEGYVSNVWVDPESQLVKACSAEIQLTAEHRLLRRNGLTNLRQYHAFAYTGSQTNSIRLANAIAVEVEKLRAELGRHLSVRSGAQTLLDDKIAFINTLRRERGVAGYTTEKVTKLRADCRQIIADTNSNKLRHVKRALEDAGLYDAYRYERDQRQNLHAATNLVKLAVLKQGGVYIPKFVLPELSRAFVDAAVRELQRAGWHTGNPGGASGPIGISALVPAISNAVLKFFTGREDPKLQSSGSTTPQGWAKLCQTIRPVFDRFSQAGQPGVFRRFRKPQDASGVFFRPVREHEDATTIDMESIAAYFGEGAGLDPVIELTKVFYAHTSQPPWTTLHQHWVDEGFPNTIDESAFHQPWFEFVRQALPGYDDPQRLKAMKTYATYLASRLYVDDGAVSKISGIEAFTRKLAPPTTDVQRLNTATFDLLASHASDGFFYTSFMENRHFTYTTWSMPSLQTRGPSNTGESSQYARQIIVQLEGDAATLFASEALYNKHPEISAYYRLGGGLDQYIYPKDAPNTPPDLSARGKVRLSIVGHGSTPGSKEQTLAGYNVQSLLRVLERWFAPGMTYPDGMVLNLVSCFTDSPVAARSTYGQLFSRELADFLKIKGIAPERISIHARTERLLVYTNGRKNAETVEYVFKKERDWLDGHYVRQIRVRQPPGDIRPPSPYGDPFRRSPLLSEPLSARSVHRGERHILFSLDEDAKSVDITTALFNQDPQHSVVVRHGKDTTFETILFDTQDDELVIREGLSGLVEAPLDKTPLEHIRLTVLGARGEMQSEASLGTYSATRLVAALEPLLRGAQLNTAGGYGPNVRVTLAFVGADLADPLLHADTTFLGQTSAALAAVLARTELKRERIILLAQGGAHTVDQAGTDQYTTSEGVILKGDLARVYEALHTAKFIFNATAGQYERERLSSETLGWLSETLESLHVREDFNTIEARYVERATLDFLKVARHASGAPALHPLGRHPREQMQAELMEVLTLRHQREVALGELQAPSGEGWKLVPLEVRKHPEGQGYQVGFVQPDAQGNYDNYEPEHIQWVRTESDAFMRWRDKALALGQALHAGVGTTPDGDQPSGRPSEATYHFSDEHIGAADESAYRASEAHQGAAVHTLTVSFLLRSLVGPEKALLTSSDEDAITALSGRRYADLSFEEISAFKHRLTFIRAQLGVNYAQLTMGLAHDAGEFVKLCRDLHRSAAALGVELRSVGKTSVVLSSAFDIAAVVFAAVELSNASTYSEKTEAAVMLGQALVNSGMSLGALTASAFSSSLEAAAAAGAGAEAAGAALAGSVAGILGALAVPVMGVGIGLGEVVKGFNRIAEEVDGVLHGLDDLLAQAQGSPLTRDAGILSFQNDLALEAFDLRTGEVAYGEIRLRKLKHVSIGAPTAGEGYFNMLTHLIGPNNRKRIDLEGLAACPVIVLPTSLARDYDYTLVPSPGWRYHDFPNLQRLEDANPGDFYWYTWRFPTDYSPSHLITTFKPTAFSLTLDAQSRTVVVPSWVDPALREKMAYTVAGGGGQYTLVLSAYAMALTLQPSASAQERWAIDLTQPLAARGATTSSLDFGPNAGLGESIHSLLYEHLAITPGALKINGATWLSYDRALAAEQLSFALSLDDSNLSRLIVQPMGLTTPGRTHLSEYQFALELSDSSVRNPRHLHALAGTLRSVLVDVPTVSVLTDQSARGLMDLSTGRVLASTYDSTRQQSNLYAGGLPRVLPGAHPLVIDAIEWGGERVLRATFTPNDVCTVRMLYKDMVIEPQLIMVELPRAQFDGVLAALLPSAHKTPALQDPRFSVLAPALIDHHNVPIALRDPSGKVVSGRLNGLDFELQTTAHSTDDFLLEVSYEAQRATLSMYTVTRFDAASLARYADVLAHAQAVEIVAIDSQFLSARLPIVLDLDHSLLQGKSITISSVARIDLTLGGKHLSWNQDGQDLILHAPGRTTVRWLDAFAPDGRVHTLALHGRPQPLLEALAQIEYRGHNVAPLVARQPEEWASISALQHPELSKKWATDLRFRVDKHGVIKAIAHRHDDTKYFILDHTPGTPKVFLCSTRILMAFDDEASAYYDVVLNSDGRAWPVLAFAEPVGEVALFLEKDHFSKAVVKATGDITAALSLDVEQEPLFERWGRLKEITSFTIMGPQARSVVTGHRSAPDVPLTIQSYYKQDANDWAEYTADTRRFILRRSEQAVLTLAEREDVMRLGPAINAYRLDFDVNTPVPERVVLDLDAAPLKGRQITLTSGAGVNLVVTGQDVSMRIQGADLLICRQDAVAVVWYDAADSHAAGHSLTLQDGPVQTLSEVLAALHKHDGIRANAINPAGDIHVARKVEITSGECVAPIGRHGGWREDAATRLTQAIASFRPGNSEINVTRAPLFSAHDTPSLAVMR